MRSVQPGMNVARQRRKFLQRINDAPDVDHAVYLSWLLGQFDADVALGVPRPASEFLPMYFEEFDVAS